MTTIEIDRIEVRLGKRSSDRARALAEGIGPEILNSIVRELESIGPGRIRTGSPTGSGQNRIRIDSINTTVPAADPSDLKGAIANSVARNAATRISRPEKR